jgi:hypothetical protein
MASIEKGGMRRSAHRLLLALVLGGAAFAISGVASVAMAASPATDTEERLRKLEAEIQQLKQELAAWREGGAPAESARVQELEKQLEVLSQELERTRIGPAAQPAAAASVHGFGPAASKVYNVERGVSIGGYGEVIYTDPSSRLDDGSPSDAAATLDLLRGVFYFGYKFNDRILFNSELEIEHATTGEGAEEKGEVSLEFAYLDFRFREGVNVRAGLLLIPVGFLNERHEPPTYLGAKRPEVERLLLPSTWRENGAGIFGDLGPVSYRVYLVAGLNAAGFTAEGIREGRQAGSQSLAEDLALTGRLDWTILPGLLVGASAFVGDSGQVLQTPTGDAIGGKIELWDVHAEWTWRGLQLRGVATETRIADAEEINVANGLAGDAGVGERIRGAYAEVGYDVLAPFELDQELIPYVRYEQFNTQEGVPTGFTANPANDRRVLTYGVAYKPIPQVVVKVDFLDDRDEAGTGLDEFHVALGFLF